MTTKWSRLSLGIVNNMPSAARRSTRRQFSEIIAAAAQVPVQIRWFAFEACDGYEPVERLWEGRLDGLIVTGNEPRQDVLTDEIYWPQLATTVEWAKHHTTSAIWSCLAAHAAVLQLDGIERQPLPRKISGVFASQRTLDDDFSADLPSTWRVPHSRCNDLKEQDLTTCGYRIAARSADAGVDMAVKKFRQSAFIFIQSHPEYDARALLREYRRDVMRFFAGERDTYPDVPQDYFCGSVTQAMASLRSEAMRERRADLLLRLQVLDLAQVAFSWKLMAMQLYRNWLGLLEAEQANAVLQVAL